MEIKLYSTLTRQKDIFVPIVNNRVNIYSCGPTVYHYQHLGNMRAVVVSDTVRRMFVYAGYEVKHVINITDVGHNVDDGENTEDKMEKGSKREGKSVWEVAQFYLEDYFKCLILLNVPLEAYVFPRATDSIPEQIALIMELETKGYTYKTSDGIYFDTSKFFNYANLARLDVEGLKSGARVEENKEKKNITDFALWKFSQKGEKRQMEWESPWGIGFPGWHIECSAMSKMYLGSHFDIHMGGKEHIPVHHTNEIAQSECANGEKYVNYWLHYNFLNDKTGKMAKSKNDFVRLQSIIDKGIPPIAYRYYLLTAHYRKEIEFSFESLASSTQAYNKLLLWCVENKTDVGNILVGYKKEFDEALCDDLAIPTCIAIIWNMINDESVSNVDKYFTLVSFDKVLGLNLVNAKKEEVEIKEDVKKLIRERKIARENKNWIESDRLRSEIKILGFEIKDKGEEQEISKL